VNKRSFITFFGLCLVTAVAAAEPAPLFPFVLPWDDASPGITDLSGWLPKPAGKFGPVRVGPDGHLYTGGRRLRLNGVDLAFSAAFPTHDQADKVAARLAKFGNNIVRFHIMDMQRFPNGLLARDTKDTRSFAPEALDRLDYFTAQLIQRGVYIYLCTLNYRPFNAADGLPSEIEQMSAPYQGRHVVGFFNPKEIELQKEYDRTLLLHRNSSTGKTYAADPAVAMIEINNENGLLHAWLGGTLDQLPEVFRMELRRQWDEWLKGRYATTERLRDAWSEGAQPLGGELLKNADFSHGQDGWTLELHQPAAATAKVTGDAPADLHGARSVCVDVQKIGTESWHVRFEQFGLKLLPKQGYTATWWAKGETPMALRVSLAMGHSPWQTLGREGTVQLSTEWQAYRLVVQPDSGAENTRLVFDPPMQTGRIWLAGISLRPGGVTGLPAGETLQAGTVASLPHDKLADRSSSATRDWVRFLWETEDAYWQTRYRYLKDELKVQGVVIGTVVGCSTPNLMAKLDCIDSHAYWQHPVFPGRPWDSSNWYVRNVSMVNARGGLLPGLALHRVLDKPFCITEYGHPAPNTFCSEGSLLRGAYAGLQDWDYLSTSRFAQRNDFPLRRIRQWFDIDQHPTKMMTLIPAAAMFLRGDVAPAKQQVVAILDRQQELDLLPGQYPWSLVDLGPRGVPPETTLVHRVALAVEGQTVPPDALRPDQVKLPIDDFVSDTGQLRWDLRRPGHGVVTINTPRSKAVVGYGGGQRYELGGLVIEPGQTRQDGWSAVTLTAIEGDLATAPSRWLITATGHVENTDMGWKNTEHTSVGNDWGKAPTLVEGIPARFTVPFAAEHVEVWALDERGQRRITVPCQPAPGSHAVIAIGPEWKTLWYEVAVHGPSSDARRNRFQPKTAIAATPACLASP
jgi:hypothetical protein